MAATFENSRKIEFSCNRSGWINAGAACVIFGRAPGVLFWVCLWCMRAAVIKFCFAVGSRVCVIDGASDICCIVKMGALSLGGFQ